jgi:hypothetical protein
VISARLVFALRVLGLCVIAILAPVAASGAAAAPTAASPRTTASGTWETTSATFNNSHQVGDSTIIDLTATASYAGTFTGTSIIQGKLMFHADGSATFHDIETFTGTVNGVSGTVTWELFGTGSPAGNVEGSMVITHSTGGLAGLHGNLHQVASVDDIHVGPFGSYSGEIW